MSEDLLSDPAWYQTLTLAERLELRRSASGAAASRGPEMEAARRRLERWRAQPPLTDASVWAASAS